jgi:hypothetical protein
MKVTVKTGLIFALVWIAFKMLFFLTGTLQEQIVPSVMLNILCILLAISIGLYKQKRREVEHTSALHDIKNAMSAGVPYALIVSCFLYFYYSNIDPEFNEHQIADAEIGIEKMLDDSAQFEAIKITRPEFEVMGKEEIFKELIEGPRAFYKASTTMTVSILALLLLATINSILITIVYRKIVFR